MAFDVSWIFRAKNLYSPEAKKIAKDTAKINKEAKRAAAALLDKGSAFRNIRAASLRARRALKGYRKETNKTSKATKGLIGKLKSFAAAGLAAFSIFKLLQTGAAFQDAIADLSAITGAAGADLDLLKDRVNELALASRVLPTDVALAFKSVASAKPELLENAELLTEVTEKVLLLKNAAGIEMVAAVDTVTRGLNIFGLAATDAGKIVDILAAGAKFGASEIRDTGEAMLIAGGAAVDAGLSFTEVNSAIQVIAKGGFKAAIAGTGLQAILQNLTEAGFDFKNLGIDGVMLQVAKGLAAIEDPAERARKKSKLFGKEHSKIASTLLRNIPLITELNEKLKTTGIASEQAGIRMNTLNSSVDEMKTRLSIFASAIFDQTTPALNSMAESTNIFLRNLDASDVELMGIALSALSRIAEGVGKTFAAAFEGVLDILKPIVATIKGIGEIVGQTVAAIATLDFGQFDISEIFNIGGKFLGIFGGEEQAQAIKNIQARQKAIDEGNGILAETGVAPITSPAVATANANATVNGNITVSASPGSQIDNIEQESFSVPQGNIGLGLAAG